MLWSNGGDDPIRHVKLNEALPTLAEAMMANAAYTFEVTEGYWCEPSRCPTCDGEGQTYRARAVAVVLKL